VRERRVAKCVGGCDEANAFHEADGSSSDDGLVIAAVT
jgi:hypothetical protein